MAALLPRLFGRSPGVPDRPRLGDNTWHVPAETAPHKACWMAWPQKSIWGHKLLPLIEADIALIANTIAKYEQVVMCAGNAAAAERARILCYTNITIIDRDITVDDCWMRDSGPIFRINSAKEHDAFGLNFNGWGNRQVHAKDKSVAQNITSYRELHFSKASVVSEGGAIEHDGDGTIIATESSIINNNRNRGKSKIQIETELLHLYGVASFSPYFLLVQPLAITVSLPRESLTLLRWASSQSSLIDLIATFISLEISMFFIRRWSSISAMATRSFP